MHPSLILVRQPERIITGRPVPHTYRGFLSSFLRCRNRLLLIISEPVEGRSCIFPLYFQGAAVVLLVWPP